jgi:hypothetical protein
VAFAESAKRSANVQMFGIAILLGSWEARLATALGSRLIRSVTRAIERRFLTKGKQVRLARLRMTIAWGSLQHFGSPALARSRSILRRVLIGTWSEEDN